MDGSLIGRAQTVRQVGGPKIVIRIAGTGGAQGIRQIVELSIGVDVISALVLHPGQGWKPRYKGIEQLTALFEGLSGSAAFGAH
jgi:hypothetical protein